MVSWYPMEGSTGDHVGNNDPSATSAVGFVAGEVAQGVTLGTDGFIDIPNAPSLQLQQITLDAWVRPDGPGPNDDGAGSCIITKNIDANDVSVQLNWTTQSGGRFLFGFGSVITSTHAFPAGDFYHVAGTYDGTTFRLYVNGALEGSLSQAQTITYTSVPWVIGANNPSGRGIGFPRTFNGVIDEVEIIGRALSGSEVVALYTAGTAGKCDCDNGIAQPGEECDDGNLDDGDGCDSNCTVTGCGNGITTSGEDCDDGNLVAGDCCSPTCQFETGGCDDGIFCNGADECRNGACTHHDGNPCQGNPVCSRTCNEVAGNCFDSATTSCTNDGNVCTDDHCDGAGACVHTANTAPCNDNLFCNGTDVCAGGTCTHTGDPCAGGPECARTCNEGGNNCFDPASTACTSDGNVCTDDHCNAAGACVHPNNTAPCNDGLFCNGADTCSGGACATHAGNPCTGGPICAHTCNEAADNCLDPPTSTCTSDGNPCTVDRCNGGGTCIHPAGNAGTSCRASTGQCDVAETCTGTSTSCPADAHQPNGTPCNDGDSCTSTDRCNAGVCVGTGTTVCDPCEVCTPSGGCILPSAPGCQPTPTGGASVFLRDGITPEKDSFKWKWKSSAPVALGDFGDPTSTTDLTFCVIDRSGLKLSATAPGAGTCGTRPCWLLIPARKLKYSDKYLTPDGVQKLQISAGVAGKGKIQVKGRGANVVLPPLGLTTPVTVRLVRKGGPACWESTFESNVSINTSDMFKAKSD
jgi:cysteine-rich repeat protein